MPKIHRLNKTPGDIVMDRDLKASVELQKDKNPASRAIDTEIKRQGTSPSKEQSLDRHAIIDIINALKGLGVDISAIESFAKYAEYDAEMERIKEECKSQDQYDGDNKE